MIDAGVVEAVEAVEAMEAMGVVVVLTVMGIGIPLVVVDGDKEGGVHMVAEMMEIDGAHAAEIDGEEEEEGIGGEVEVVDDRPGVIEGTALGQAKSEAIVQDQSTGEEIQGVMRMVRVGKILGKQGRTSLQVNKRKIMALLGGSVPAQGSIAD